MVPPEIEIRNPNICGIVLFYFPFQTNASFICFLSKSRDHLHVFEINVFLFSLGANANWYKANSFTQYRVKQSKRKRRELVPPPVSMANEFFTNIALQVKISPNSSNVVVFLASNSLGTEFNRIDVRTCFVIDCLQSLYISTSAKEKAREASRKRAGVTRRG